VVGTATIGAGCSSATALAIPVADPPPSATRQSAPASRAAVTARAAASAGTCCWTSVKLAAQRPPSRSTRPSMARLPAIASTRRAPRRSTSPTRDPTEPAPKTTRPANASWTNDGMGGMALD
jgi:hypothetical protein